MAFSGQPPRTVPDDTAVPAHLAINEPRQRRSREAWRRVLEAGIALVERDGYEGFTITALSEASGINPRAIYERAASKDALFLAVYEHKMAQMVEQRDQLMAATTEPGITPTETVRRAVHAVLRLFTDDAAFLRAVMAVAPRHPIVYERGRRHIAVLGDLFAGALEGIAPDPRPLAARLAFRTVYAMAVLRTVQGPDFLAPALGFDEELAHLSEVVERYLQVSTPMID
ncbi:TetR/AcrR family transcriptional regulator [Nocardia sp. NPDC005366]|uniref:TetR/AcrR family transcriptional regulator n=1 Tax=Nocardia sp. NPDC005366 TaxID=3156878 RepID=UPI0033B9FD4D